MKIGVIVGSHRSDSESAKVGRFLSKVLSSTDGVSIWSLDLGKTPLPLWDEELWRNGPQWSMMPELKSELDQREGVSSMVDEVAAALRAERERHSKEIAEARVFMPETVRQVLVTANQCLRVDGQQGLRFFKASKITCVLSGHRHQDIDIVWQDVRLIMSIGTSNWHHYPEETSFKLVTVFDDGFSVRRVSVETMA